MQLFHSADAASAPADPKVARLLETITGTQLRKWVERIAFPRHFTAEPQQNRAAADYIAATFESFGYHVQRQGACANLIATPESIADEAVLVGAHYDSIPECPGADDNASAVAALLGCAGAIALWRPVLPIVFVAFNREEDGLEGSRDFVENFLPKAPFKVRCAHILEMVGYASSAANSQRIPPGLPIKLRNAGDFLGLLANDESAHDMQAVIRRAPAYTPTLPVTGLTVIPGAERALPVLARSDHAPFWRKQIPAVMWTDTAEFRNPNYHRATDTPGTLDYTFLMRVTQLLTAAVIERQRQ